MRNLRAQSGQAVIEAVLLVTIMTAITLFVSREFRSKGYFATLVSAPWSYLDGMIQHGVWQPVKKARAADAHFGSRRSTTIGEMDP